MKRCISVVIPTWNAASLLESTLRSLFDQTRKPEEILIVDDASTDGTQNLIRRLAATSPVQIRFEGLPSNTGGPSAPTNRGLELAKGDFIALLDHDDVMLPDKLEKQASVLENNSGVDLVLSDYEHFTSEGTLAESDARQWEPEGHQMLGLNQNKEVQVLDPAQFLKTMVRRPGLALSCSSYFFRRDLWRRVGGFNHQFKPIADYEFLLRAADQPVAWIDRVLFRKRVHDQNHWRSFVANPIGKWASERSAARAQRKMLKRFPRNSELRKLVAAHTAYVADGFTSARQFAAAFAEAMCLLKLREPANAIRVCARIAAATCRGQSNQRNVAHNPKPA